MHLSYAVYCSCVAKFVPQQEGITIKGITLCILVYELVYIHIGENFKKQFNILMNYNLNR